MERDPQLRERMFELRQRGYAEFMQVQQLIELVFQRQGRSTTAASENGDWLCYKMGPGATGLIILERNRTVLRGQLISILELLEDSLRDMESDL